MQLLSLTWQDVVWFIVIVWVTTGLSVIHVGVLAARTLTGWRRRGARAEPRAEPRAKRRKRPTLTFVIAVYNDEKTIAPAVESILRQSVRPDCVLVVDDGSTDGTPRVLAGLRSRGVDVLTLGKNVGKSHALDAALKEVDTDLVAITDADSIVHVDYVKEVLRSFEDPEMAAVGGAVESIPHTAVTAARQLEYMLTVNIDRNAETTMEALVVLPGVSTTYRTSVLRELGFEFDTIAEDFDLTFRMHLARKKFCMNLRAKVFTSDPPTFRAYYRQLLRWYTDFWLVLRKNRRVIGKRVFGTVEVPMLVMNATASSVAYLALPVYFAFADPSMLWLFFGSSFVFDLVLVVVAWRVYGRRDVWSALLTRIPTRFIARTAYCVAMVRVWIGRPGLEWTKLERRSTDRFLAESHGERALVPAPAAAVAAAARPGGTSPGPARVVFPVAEPLAPPPDLPIAPEVSTAAEPLVTTMPPLPEPPVSLPVDVYDAGPEYRVLFDLPGATKDEVFVEAGEIPGTVAVRTVPVEPALGRPLVLERTKRVPVSRTLAVAADADVRHMRFSLDDGVLVVVVPKVPLTRR